MLYPGMRSIAEYAFRPVDNEIPQSSMIPETICAEVACQGSKPFLCKMPHKCLQAELYLVILGFSFKKAWIVSRGTCSLSKIFLTTKGKSGAIWGEPFFPHNNFGTFPGRGLLAGKVLLCSGALLIGATRWLKPSKDISKDISGGCFPSVDEATGK